MQSTRWIRHLADAPICLVLCCTHMSLTRHNLICVTSTNCRISCNLYLYLYSGGLLYSHTGARAEGHIIGGHRGELAVRNNTQYPSCGCQHDTRTILPRRLFLVVTNCLPERKLSCCSQAGTRHLRCEPKWCWALRRLQVGSFSPCTAVGRGESATSLNRT